MVDTRLFPTRKGRLPPTADTLNHERAAAYALSPRHQLAQLAATGCLNRTFYADAGEQLDLVLALAREVDPAFIAKTAIHARQAGHMKDMPALLLAVLAVRDVKLLEAVFGRVVDSGKMLRAFVQIVRSGTVGRKSLGSLPRKLVQRWLLTAGEAQLLHAVVGNAPSLADVVKMVHPRPTEAWRAAWFAWLIGKPFDEAALPPATRAFQQFKRALGQGLPLPELPTVPFQMLSALTLSAEAWASIARAGSWQMVRQNLNTFARHGAFRVPGTAQAVAAKLRDPKAVARARVLPYQLLAAHQAVTAQVPGPVREALADAMEIALANVPQLDGHVVVCPDVSGSMGSPATGWRKGATTAVRCIDVAALVAAAICARNRHVTVLPFAEKVVQVALNRRDPVLVNAGKLAAVGGGGTNVSAPLALLNEDDVSVDLVVMVSDNQSWVDACSGGATATMRQWAALKARCPRARLVCIDIQPYATTQAAEQPDVLNVGGFSDAVFGVVAQFADGTLDAGHWVAEIEKIALELQ